MIIITALDTGGILTLPIVFSTLALLQQLRTSIGRQWTRSIETGTDLRALHSTFSIYLFFLTMLSCFDYV